MRGISADLTAAIGLLLASGCTTPATLRRDPPLVLLPAPPAEAKLRLAGLLPDPDAPPRPVPWWRTVFRVVTGADDGPQSDPAILVRPFGVALADGGVVFVADPDAGRVVRYAPGEATTDLRCEDLPWDGPIALSTSPTGELYVADASAGIVIRWGANSCAVIGRGELERPTAVAVSGGHIWVADPPRHRLVAFDRDGATVATVGERGDGVGQFHFPSAITATSDGMIAVVDSLNFRVVLLDAAGGWVSTFGGAGTSGGAFSRPKGVAADESGGLWVTDAQRDAVLVFDRGGTFAYEFGATGGRPGEFEHPAGIAVTRSRVAVADSQNHRVQLFERIGVPQ